MRHVTHNGFIKPRLQLHQFFYEDWYEMLQLASDLKRTVEVGEWSEYYLNNSYYLASRKKTDSDSWSLGHSWDDVIDMARCSGWIEGMEKVRPMVEDVEAELGSQMITAQPRHDVQGAYVDVGAFVTGEPECMIDFPEEQADGSGKVLSMVIACSFSNSITAHSIFRRGAAIVAFVDLLERLGYRLEIILSIGTDAFGEPIGKKKKRRMYFEWIVPLKRATDPVPVERLVFALCHPGMSRRIGFALREQLPKEYRAISNIGFNVGNYGWAMNPTHVGYPVDIVIPRIHDCDTHFLSDQSAKAWLRDQLVRQGVIFSEPALSVL